MTKRAFQKFPRAAGDFYPTPREAVVPLYPHVVRDNTLFAEPCYGDGSLADHLIGMGLKCVARGDLNDDSKKDARLWSKRDFDQAGVVVTNPPWEAQLMMEIMWRQSDFLPSWFLIYSDWLFTHQSHDLMRMRCTDVVPIGRLKWIKGSKSVGFDNCCWVRMWAGKTGAFHAKFWSMAG
jgi:hypothetical protein